MEPRKTGRPSSGQTGGDVSEDPRAAHTRSVLQQALMGLLEQGDWGRITVAGICRRAGVARSSFYEHYRTKSDLLDQIFSDLMVSILPTFRQDEPLGTLNWLVDHVAEAPDFFAEAMAGGRGDALLPRFREALILRLSEELSARHTPDARLRASYLVGGSMAYLALNNKADSREFVHEMAARLII